MSAHLHVVLDPMYGCWANRVRRYLHAIFPQCLFSTVHDTPDATFAGSAPDCSRSKNLAELGEAVYRESGGNPFYLEQLGRSGASPGEPEKLETQRPRESRIAPPRVIAAITDRLDRLADGDRVVLEAAAVAGEAFTPGLVAAIAEVDDVSALEAVDELVRADLIRTASAPQRFEFRHPIG